MYKLVDAFGNDLYDGRIFDDVEAYFDFICALPKDARPPKGSELICIRLF